MAHQIESEFGQKPTYMQSFVCDEGVVCSPLGPLVEQETTGDVIVISKPKNFVVTAPLDVSATYANVLINFPNALPNHVAHVTLVDVESGVAIPIAPFFIVSTLDSEVRKGKDVSIDIRHFGLEASDFTATFTFLVTFV